MFQSAAAPGERRRTGLENIEKRASWLIIYSNLLNIRIIFTMERKEFIRNGFLAALSLPVDTRTKEPDPHSMALKRPPYLKAGDTIAISSPAGYITLEERNNQIIINVEDNGKGFDSTKTYNSDGFGLTQIKARVKNLKGKVFVTFVVEKDGSLSDIKVIRDIGLGTGEEAIRVLKECPKWLPGEQNGQKVRVLYSLPISIQLP